jgi:hypothetical protein
VAAALMAGVIEEGGLRVVAAGRVISVSPIIVTSQTEL